MVTKTKNKKYMQQCPDRGIKIQQYDYGNIYKGIQGIFQNNMKCIVNLCFLQIMTPRIKVNPF